LSYIHYGTKLGASYEPAGIVCEYGVKEGNKANLIVIDSDSEYEVDSHASTSSLLHSKRRSDGGDKTAEPTINVSVLL